MKWVSIKKTDYNMQHEEIIRIGAYSYTKTRTRDMNMDRGIFNKKKDNPTLDFPNRKWTKYNVGTTILLLNAIIKTASYSTLQDSD